jgi:hypothetical protein
MPLPTTVATRSTARSEPAARDWRATLLRAVDVLVAFATLREPDGAGGELAARPAAGDEPGRRPAAGDKPGRRPPAGDELGGRPAGEMGAPQRRAWEHGPRAVAAAAHPHRRPLRGPSRARRPGAVRPAPQACVTPLTPARVPRRRERVAGPPH